MALNLSLPDMTPSFNLQGLAALCLEKPLEIFKDFAAVLALLQQVPLIFFLYKSIIYLLF